LQDLLSDLGQKMSVAAVQELFKSMDVSGDGRVDFDEFCAAVMLIVQQPQLVQEIEAKTRPAPLTDQQKLERKRTSALNLHIHSKSSSSANLILADEENSIGGSPLQRAQFAGSSVGLTPIGGHGDEDEDEEIAEDEAEEVPEDLRDLTPEQQQTAIKWRAAWMMAFGTFLILLFSDPMVGGASIGCQCAA
jgi:hypothetical protein